VRTQHSAPDGEALPPSFVVREDNEVRIAICGFFRQRERSIFARFNDDNDLVPKIPRLPMFSDSLQRGWQPVRLVIGWNNK
jgi:hypothetical protein